MTVDVPFTLFFLDLQILRFERLCLHISVVQEIEYVHIVF